MPNVLINEVWVSDGEPVGWPLNVPMKLASGETATAREHRRTTKTLRVGHDRTPYTLWEVWGELTPAS